MELIPELREELNLIALSENMSVEEVAHAVLTGFTEDYWIELKQKPKACVGFQGDNK